MNEFPPWVALLVEAYDHLEDLLPDPEYESPDEEMEDWIERADKALFAATGKRARELVDERLAEWRTSL